MSLYFHNPGHLDIRGATIAGLSAKDTDAPIGYFGTGLKYAIACILRWDGAIEIRVGNDYYRFSKEQLSFRGTDHDRVILTGPDGTEPLGFTTSYGKNWKPWQVFRELLANARDEGGDVANNVSGIPANADTVIAVTCPELEAEYANRHEIILPPTTNWLEEHPAGKVLDRPSKYIYYRGVRVADKPTRNTYNLTQELSLTEDRTVKESYYASRAVAQLLASCEERTVIYDALTAPKESFEGNLVYNSWDSFSDTFLDVATELFQRDRHEHKKLETILQENRPSAIIRTPLDLTTIQHQQLRRACKLVSRMGYPIREHEVVVTDLGSSILGMHEAGVIYLCPGVFRQGTKQVVATLYEECLHKATGLKDLTYDMQNHLFNLIVGLHEEHVFGEPC